MATIYKNRYNSQGELLASYEIEKGQRELRYRIQGPASFERGYVHYFEFRATDEFQLLRKLGRFIAMLDQAKGKILFYEDRPAPSLRGENNGLISMITYVVE